MNCNDFAVILAEYKAGKLAPGVRAAAEEHLRNCAVCMRLSAIIDGKIEVLPEAGVDGLARSIIDCTSGPACERAQASLCCFVDGESGETDSGLMALHLAHCSQCESLADALVMTRELLPEMVEITPASDFARSVIATTSGWRPIKPGLGNKLLAWWNSLIRRPRFSFEAAYVGTLALVFTFGSPALPFQGVAIDKIATHVPGQVAAGKASQRIVSALIDARASVLLSSGRAEDFAAITGRTFSASLNGTIMRHEAMLFSMSRGLMQRVDACVDKGNAVMRALLVRLSIRNS